MWERAHQLREESQSCTTNPSDQPWWTDEWLDGLQNDNFGDYPIICRVERTHAEFPPDPYSKVVESNSKSDGTILHFKKPKKFAKIDGKVSMRLAVTLRPLSHVMVQSIKNGFTSQNLGISVPPLFAVITFPCELEPFLVPFVWGYIKSHSISPNQKLSLCNDMTNDVRVDAFVPLSGRDTMRMDDRQSDFTQFFSNDRADLEKILETQDLIIPTREARIVFDLWCRRCTKDVLKTGANDAHLQLSDHFKYLLQSTLPLWQSIFIRKRTYDVHKPRVSAWSLAPIGQGRETINAYFNYLDDALRLKIERALHGIMSSDSEAKDLFFDPITEDIAPSYNCAVPLGMSFSAVMQRLRVHIGYKSCYYRTVEAVLADISWILECCLLYNSPESEVVDIAANVIDNTKDILSNVIRDHYKYIKSARSKDCERPLVMLQPRLWFNNFGRKSGNVNINRDWLDVKLSTTVDPTAKVGQINDKEAPFQVGDVIMYSRNLHNRFIVGHCSSLEHDQCHVPSTEHATENINLLNPINDWEQGIIISTHAVFPKILTRDEKDTFNVSAMLQCLGVKFGKDNCPSALFWRPCLFNSGDDNSRPPCPGCGLTSSFVKLSPNENVGDSLTDTTETIHHQTQSILCCIDLLKRKCLHGIDPDQIDSVLVPSNVKPAYKTSIAKLGKNVLPSYDKLLGFAPQPTGKEQLHHGTRGTMLKPKDDDDAITALLPAGFLPRWIDAARGGTTNDDFLRKVDMILPVTKLSLEYISLKIKCGFYRHIAAIENDVIEAYISIVYSVLFEAATRKKTAISIRRISQLVTREKSECSDIGVEEQDYMSQIHHIRRLYGTALVAVLDVERTQRVFGLSRSSPPKRNLYVPKKEDSNQVYARQRLEHLVMALRRENTNISSNEVEGKDGMPCVTLNIVFSKPAKREHLVAKKGGSRVKVNIYIRGRAFPNLGISSQKESCQIISFGPKEYEQHEALAQFLFARPGRCGPCARCQVYRRTMVACRVLRKHKNLDCDWSTLVSDGIDFVDDQIKILDPVALNGAGDDLFENSQQEKAQLESLPPDHSTSMVDSGDVNDPDPSEFLKLATTTLTQATELADAANAYAKCPLRLSKKFIETTFPIDKSDGHFLYCVLCGLSGDLLCCDGCPNVVHAKCISLVNLPEGDWFCEKCDGKESGIDESLTRNPDDSKFSSIYSYDENGSPSFHESKVDMILSQLDNLRSSRPTQKPKEGATKINENTDISVATSSKTKETSSVVVPANKEVAAVDATKSIEINVVANTENKKVNVLEDKRISALVVTTRSMRTRSDHTSKDLYRPSIVKRRRIERAAV